LRDSLSAGALGVKLEGMNGNKLSNEEKQEVINRGARVVNQVQIKALAEVIRLLADEIFNDDQESYFIVIDDLDTKWVDDPLKFKLIRALIETIKTFRQIKNVKIIVAIRQDLLLRVIQATRDSGFQSEKYASLYYKLRWNKSQIINLLNKRISFLVKQRYTTKSVPLEELLPKKIGQTSCIDYIIERTFLRPRDAILFVNECIERAADKGTINTSMVYEAEGAYSQSRIDSLQEEWNTIYPRVSDYLRVFTRRPAKQKISDFSQESINEWLIDTLLQSQDLTDPVVKAGTAFINESKNSNFRFLLTLFEALYIVGAVGIKPDTGNTENWSFYSDYTPSEGSLKPTSVISLHPTFWRAIGARDAS
jgi:hypothetical protein